MAFSADTMVVTLALAKAFTLKQIEAITTGGIVNIKYNELTNSLEFEMSDGSKFSVVMPPQLTQDEKNIVSKLGVDSSGKLTYDGNLVDNGMVKVDVDDEMSYLGLKLDTTTIGISATKKLEAISLKGLLSSISEINYLQGLDANIMEKFALFGNGAIKAYTTTFPSYADLLAFDFTQLDSQYTYLMYVSSDVNHSNNGTVYLANNTTNNTTNLPSFAGLSTATQRDLSVDKVDLTNAKEVIGILPQANMDLSGLVRTIDLSGYMLKSVYDQNDNGIVDKAETLEGLTATIPQINAGVPLANLIKTDGTGTKFFSDDGTYRTPSGGGGGSSVAPSEINGNIINNGEQMVVYDDSQLQSDIDSLNNRSVIGSENVYFGAKLSASQTTTTVGENIKFDTIVKNSSNSEITLNNGVFKLKGGIKWNVRCGVKILGTGVLSYQIYNITEQHLEGDSNQVISVTNTTNTNQSAIIDEILEPNVDCLYEMRIISSTNVTSIDSNITNLKIFEIGRTVILDPIEYAQDHDIKYGEFSTSVNTATANVPLVLDTTISGTMTLDTSRNGIRVTGGKTYKIQIYGTPIISSVASLKCYIYDCTNNVNTNKLVDQSVSVASTDNWTNMGSGLYFKPESSMTISVLFDRNITNLNGGGAFKILIEEVKNPVLINSEKVIEISNPLMSSQISQEAPIGTIIRYDGNNVPNYYLPCDGAIYNISDYLALFNEIGNKYGGDGITTFAVPNYSGDKFYIKSEATHYAINQYGGFQMDTLWEGNASENDSLLSLVSEYTDYDGLYIDSEYDGISSTAFILTDSIVNNVSRHGIQVLGVSVDTSSSLTFVDNTTIKLTNNIGKIIITKVVGLKGSIPSVIDGGAL